ncbi:4-coumarate-CoA ligase [Heterostelium album PN500]|uniref:4-coumarate-CoA ligase n=1 Tax=Heterostelium pallidum (strain ATCC 26659 / Pp 5 / PN500) TaxID=670386 RepID=D3BQM9_HETP5|nr:4-coumarate-CoA ligase [Heterostelium album PN500]EFA76449.1 4-coumarate-CoA ligase [Heterostelium album PN500]|eukprot:XP_020428581.1 4-coumarate-CoA ligase [Heterostelium album PN500]
MVIPKGGLSVVIGDQTCELSQKTVYELLLDTKDRFPERIAVVFSQQNIRLTYTEFLREVEAMAAGLLAIGVKKGDRLGIWSPNRVEWLITQFSSALIGAILVNINPAYRLSELEYALNKVGCSTLVVARSFKTSKYIEMLCELAPEIRVSTNKLPLTCKRLPSLRRLIEIDTGCKKTEHVSGITEFSDLMKLGKQHLTNKLGGHLGIRAIARQNRCEEPINIQFTSGTTGNPKSATLTHKNIVNNALFMTRTLKMSEVDAMCIPVPLYHCFGMVMSVLVCVMVGAKLVFPGEAFDPKQTLAAVEKERCTALQGVPTMFIAELEHCEKYDLRSLRTGIMAGSPCPVETMKSRHRQSHSKRKSTDSLEKRTTTVGRCQPHLEVKLVGEDGKIVKVGEIGEIWVRGYSVMLGYWGEPAGRNGLHDGWMATGDLGTFDEEGYCSVIGRLKDMVIRGGENVYPREIEEFLFKHPKIQTVQVFGVPDEKYGEELCAWIILKHDEQSTEDEIKQFCKGQISHFKIPKYIKFVKDMPLTVTGKVQKFVMREMMNNELLAMKPVVIPKAKL